MLVRKIENARLYQPNHSLHGHLVDITIKDHLIANIELHVNDVAHQEKTLDPSELEPSELDPSVFDGNGLFISAGFIDVHVHCYYGSTAIGINADDIGVTTGVTTLIDAGTSGADTLSDFVENHINKVNTRVQALLNVSSKGLLTLNELSEPDAIDPVKVATAIKAYPSVISGLKVRASGSVLGTQGIKPIEKAKALSSKLGLPLIVHIGNAPPKVEHVLPLLAQGDVVTHCFNNKPNGLFNEKGLLKTEGQNAKDLGVVFDVGHGTSSFSYKVAEAAIINGLKPDLIGSDLYDKNKEGPVVSLVRTMNKLLVSGMDLNEVIHAVTAEASKVHNLIDRGQIKEGLLADFTVFSIDHATDENNNHENLEDSVGEIRQCKNRIVPKYTLVGGQLFKVNPGGI